MKLALEKIRLDGGTQSRAELNQFTVDSYAEAMAAGVRFPALIVFYDGTHYWCADGFHRAAAGRQAGIKSIEVEVKQGTARDARLYSSGANSAHGLPRTNADKRRAALNLIEDAEWSRWSDRAIAKHCAVSQPFVSKLREEAERTDNGYQSAAKRVGLDGKARPVGTERIVPEVRDLLRGTDVADDRGESRLIAKLRPDQQRVVAKLLVRGDARNVREAVDRSKRIQIQKVADRINREPEPLPTGPFRVVVIDPSWPYELRNEDPSHRGRMGYPPMTIEQICALEVPKVAHPDAILWMWWTNAFQEEAVDVLRAWGFKSKVVFTWDKVAPGPGNYAWNVTEHVTLAIRGNPHYNRAALSDPSVRTLFTERKREASRKPEVFYQLVEKTCPGSRLEMFARQSRKGWTTWGAEKDLFDEKKSVQAG